MLLREVQWEQQLVMTMTVNRWEGSTVSSNLSSFARNTTKYYLASLHLKLLLLLHPDALFTKMDGFFFVSTTHPPLLKFQGISLAFCFPSKTLAFESPSLQWSHFGIGSMDVSWNIQQDSSDKWIKMNKDFGGHGCDSCRGLRFFLCPFLVSCWQIHLSTRQYLGKWFQSHSLHCEHNRPVCEI